MHRTFVAALVLCVAASAAGAQQPAPQPPPANPVVQSFKIFHDAYSRWLTMAFDSFPEAKYNYKPMPVQQTVGYIAQHLESANYQLCAQFGGTPWIKTAKDSLADTVKARWPKDTLVARLRASFKFCDAAFARVTDQMVADGIPAPPPNSARVTPRVRFMISYVTDLAEHWSQIANYMRLNGMVPASALPRPKA